MKTPAQNLEDAMSAIQALNYQMQDGDPESADAIRQIGLRAADALQYSLTVCAPALGSHRAAKTACEHSTSWPVNLPALEELRQYVIENELPGCLGSAVIQSEKRTGKGNTRKPAEAGGFRFAYEVFLVLEARRRGQRMPVYDDGAPWLEDAAKLPALSHSTLDEWARVGRSLVHWDFLERDRTFAAVDPEILPAIHRRHIKEQKSYESCFDAVVKRRLKGGFKSLIGKGDAEKGK